MNRFWQYKSSLLPISIAALLALILLATLQYHWVGQVSEGEHERMQANLRAGALRFSEDFDREIARIYLNFQMDAATLRDKAWDRYAQRYTRWFETAPYPGLVQEVYLVEVNAIGGLSLTRFNPALGRFEVSAWPDELGALHDYFERTYRNDRSDAELSLGRAFDPIAADVPALLVPLSRVYLLSDRQNPDIYADLIFSDTVLPQSRPCVSCRPGEATPLLAHTIVRLDRDYIEQTFIPDLARRNFSTGNGLDYNMTIVSYRQPEQIIYSTSPQRAVSDPAAGDITVDLFTVRFDELNRLLLDTSQRIEEAGPDSPPGSERLTVGILGRPPAGETGNDAETSAEQSDHWRLILQHRAGSLDAAVAGLRVRNLIVSFTILLILAGSVVLMVIATRQAQRLAQQQMSFAAAVSHELRTPLSVICAAGENLADGLIHDPQKAQQYGAVIRGEGRRLAEMVEQVLDFASTQSGQKTYQLRPVEVNALVETALAALHLPLTEGGFTVERDLQPDLPVVMADLAAIKRSVQNVLTNAMKYGGEGRWIGVQTRAQASAQGPEVLITVADRGIGIAPGDLPHIFQPFYRGHSVMTAQIHGSGLGLSLVKHAVEAHGGRVSVASAAGQGACLTLHLPAVAPEAALSPAAIGEQFKAGH